MTSATDNLSFIAASKFTNQDKQPKWKWRYIDQFSGLQQYRTVNCTLRDTQNWATVRLADEFSRRLNGIKASPCTNTGERLYKQLLLITSYNNDLD